MSETNKPEKSTGTITPEIEIAWARAVSRAFDDPTYYRQLKANTEKALTDLGADVSEIDDLDKIGSDGRLTPTLAVLDESIRESVRKRPALPSTERPAYQAPGAAPSQPTQSGVTSSGTPYPATVHLHIQPYAFSALPRCTGSTCVQPMCVQPQGYWGPFGMLPGSPCVAFSQVATTRASSTRGPAAPQWIGGPPSGADRSV